MKKILPSFSYIFHPIFIPILGTLLYLFLAPNYFEIHQKKLILIQVATITIFVPLSFFYFLKSLGKVDTVMLAKISQRKIPLFIHIILLIILIEKGITLNRIPELYFFFLGGIISTIVTFILLFANIKVSIHMIGISTLTIFVLGLSLHHQINLIIIISIVILLNGIVASSRLYLNAHTLKEIGWGLLIGISPQLLLFYFWL